MKTAESPLFIFHPCCRPKTEELLNTLLEVPTAHATNHHHPRLQ